MVLLAFSCCDTPTDGLPVPLNPLLNPAPPLLPPLKLAPMLLALYAAVFSRSLQPRLPVSSRFSDASAVLAIAAPV
ncbi:hypothetical protein B1992_14990, partial [Pseudoxanthomonas broegbernensis]